jgi:ABC-type antimicrobial peptide transport system permease subunit
MAWDAVFFSGRINLRFRSPDVLLPVASVLVLIMFVACVIPARRAARLDPVAALRGD